MLAGYGGPDTLLMMAMMMMTAMRVSCPSVYALCLCDHRIWSCPHFLHKSRDTSQRTGPSSGRDRQSPEVEKKGTARIMGLLKPTEMEMGVDSNFFQVLSPRIHES